MDERARDVKGEEPQEPENQEDHEDRPEHCCLLIPGDFSGQARVLAGLFAKIEPTGPTSTVSQDPGSRPWQASNQQCADRPGPPLGRTLASCGMLFPKERKKERKKGVRHAHKARFRPDASPRGGPRGDGGREKSSVEGLGPVGRGVLLRRRLSLLVRLEADEDDLRRR